jgi:hypothetical protein
MFDKGWWPTAFAIGVPQAGIAFIAIGIFYLVRWLHG